MKTILENALIERLSADMPRSEFHVGCLQESDAEIIRTPGSETLLAVTTDSIVEEIEIGLYVDPYLIGWMVVIANASDLAAVGADPLGILLSESIPADMPHEDVSALQNGIRDACVASQLPVLGGDTNTAQFLQVGATAIGVIPSPPVITRMGCTPGDLLFASGLLGLGSCYALQQLEPASVSPSLDAVDYRPTPNFRKGSLVRSVASACMDTSDGALATLDQLMRLNHVGFVVSQDTALHPAASRLANHAQLPPWMMLAGLHGEFELMFTVSPARVDELMSRASAQGWSPIEIGYVVSTSGVWIDDESGRTELDTGSIRNLFAETPGDIRACIHYLKTLGEPCTQ